MVAVDNDRGVVGDAGLGEQSFHRAFVEIDPVVGPQDSREPVPENCAGDVAGVVGFLIDVGIDEADVAVMQMFGNPLSIDQYFSMCVLDHGGSFLSLAMPFD